MSTKELKKIIFGESNSEKKHKKHSDTKKQLKSVIVQPSASQISVSKSGKGSKSPRHSATGSSYKPQLHHSNPKRLNTNYTSGSSQARIKQSQSQSHVRVLEPNQTTTGNSSNSRSNPIVTNTGQSRPQNTQHSEAQTTNTSQTSEIDGSTSNQPNQTHPNPVQVNTLPPKASHKSGQPPQRGERTTETNQPACIQSKSGSQPSINPKTGVSVNHQFHHQRSTIDGTPQQNKSKASVKDVTSTNETEQRSISTPRQSREVQQCNVTTLPIEPPPISPQNLNLSDSSSSSDSTDSDESSSSSSDSSSNSSSTSGEHNREASLFNTDVLSINSPVAIPGLTSPFSDRTQDNDIEYNSDTKVQQIVTLQPKVNTVQSNQANQTARAVSVTQSTTDSQVVGRSHSIHHTQAIALAQSVQTTTVNQPQPPSPEIVLRQTNNLPTAVTNQQRNLELVPISTAVRLTQTPRSVSCQRNPARQLNQPQQPNADQIIDLTIENTVVPTQVRKVNHPTNTQNQGHTVNQPSTDIRRFDPRARRARYNQSQVVIQNFNFGGEQAQIPAGFQELLDALNTTPATRRDRQRANRARGWDQPK